MSSIGHDELLSVISKVFAPANVTTHSTFDELGVTSVVRLRLLVAIQQGLDVDLDVVDIFSVEDVAGLTRLVEDQLPQHDVAPR